MTALANTQHIDHNVRPDGEEMAQSRSKMLHQQLVELNTEFIKSPQMSHEASGAG